MVSHMALHAKGRQGSGSSKVHEAFSCPHKNSSARGSNQEKDLKVAQALLGEEDEDAESSSSEEGQR